MKKAETALSWIGFGFLAVAVLVGPWLFGAWEMWWFWPFACCIFVATLVFALRLLLPGRASPAMPAARPAKDGNRLRWIANLSLAPFLLSAGEASPARTAARPAKDGNRLRWIAILSLAPFLLYAFVRLMTAEVFADAERSFMLFLTPLLVAVHMLFGFTRRQLRLMYLLVFVDLCLLGAYGLVNHVLFASKTVLWLPGYAQYTREVRATGSYFCPDHFAGIMELGVCLGLGKLMAKESSWRQRTAAGLLIAIGVAGVVLSKSRGGGLALVVIAVAACFWGFSQWPPITRWSYRVSAASAAGIAILLFAHFAGSYTDRFGRWFGWEQARNKPWPKMKEVISESVMRTTRGQMVWAALRAWQKQPVLGIGPGMHQNLWPHIGPTADGDKDTGKWPTRLNNAFFSYEVHSDWVQLLEEYGALGLGLFLVPTGTVFYLLFVGYRREREGRSRNHWHRSGLGYFDVALGAMLCFVCMAFHSLGDFNLQMPATTWLLAAILTVPIGLITSAPAARRKKRR